MANDYDVIIVGAGLGGLTTASLLTQRGQNVLIVDKHKLPGGYATNFQRGDFTFDASLHSFDGMIPGAYSYKVIEAAGIADKVEFIPHERLYTIKTLNHGEIVVNYQDLDGYILTLIQLFPEEKKAIRKLFAEMVKMYKDVGGFVFSRLPFLARLAATPVLYHKILRYERSTVKDFFLQYTHNEELIKILSAQWTYYGLPPERLAFGYFGYPTIDYLMNGGFCVKGGSQILSDALVSVIEKHGGTVKLSAPVRKIIVDKGRAIGVTIKGLGDIYGKKIIANANPYIISDLIGDSCPIKLNKNLSKSRPSNSGFQIYLGLDCELDQFGVAKEDSNKFIEGTGSLKEQFRLMMQSKVESNKTGYCLTYFSNADQTLAPAGKSTLGLFSLVGSKGWFDITKTEYREKKKNLTAALLEKAELELPGLGKHIEICETATPRTMRNFTGNYQGSIYGFEQSVHQNGLFNRFPQKYPIKDLYQVGSWTFPGGGYIGTMLSAQLLVGRYF